MSTCRIKKGVFPLWRVDEQGCRELKGLEREEECMEGGGGLKGLGREWNGRGRGGAEGLEKGLEWKGGS